MHVGKKRGIQRTLRPTGGREARSWAWVWGHRALPLNSAHCSRQKPAVHRRSSRQRVLVSGTLGREIFIPPGVCSAATGSWNHTVCGPGNHPAAVSRTEPRSRSPRPTEVSLEVSVSSADNKTVSSGCQLVLSKMGWACWGALGAALLGLPLREHGVAAAWIGCGSHRSCKPLAGVSGPQAARRSVSVASDPL